MEDDQTVGMVRREAAIALGCASALSSRCESCSALGRLWYSDGSGKWDGRPRDRAALVHGWSCYGSSLVCRVACCPLVVARHHALKSGQGHRRTACVALTVT